MRQIPTLLITTAILGLSASTHRPNIILILTDDQDVALGGLTPLKWTKRLIADEGITFTNAFATTPICCPSRSSILTGLYLHSHGTVNNTISGGCCGKDWLSRHEGKTFAVALHDIGYRTFYSGKYLNTYGKKGSGGVKHIPKGWDWWVGLVGNSVYYNYSLSVNGTRVKRGERDSDYLTDVLREYSLEFLKQKTNAPFLMVVAPPSPHEPFTPARRHEGAFRGLKAPRTPSFNLPVNKTKHWLLRLPPDVLPQETVSKIDEVFQNRWESLLSVDELVRDIFKRLEELEILNNTYVMFTSDHGFHMGQFGQPWDKRQPYDTDIRIPLLIRGPEIFKTVCDSSVLSIDFAATILDMAGVSVKKFGDGESILPRVNSFRGEVQPRNFLVEYHGEGGGGKNECNDDPNVKLCDPATSCKCFDAKNNTYMCVRRFSEKADDIYCDFEDGESFEEFYDIRKDPYQVENLAGIVGAETQRRMLECCKWKIQSGKAVDECLGTYFGKTEVSTKFRHLHYRQGRSAIHILPFVMKEPEGFQKAKKKEKKWRT